MLGFVPQPNLHGYEVILSDMENKQRADLPRL